MSKHVDTLQSCSDGICDALYSDFIYFITNALLCFFLVFEDYSKWLSNIIWFEGSGVFQTILWIFDIEVISFFFFWSQWILQQIPRWTVSWRENLGDDIAGAKAMSIFMAFAVFLQIVFERRWLQWGRECSTWASAVCWARKVLRAWYLLVQTLLLSFSFPECLRCSGQVA